MNNTQSVAAWYDDADDLSLGEEIQDPTILSGKTLKDLKAYVDALILKEGEDTILFEARIDEDGVNLVLVREKEQEETL